MSQTRTVALLLSSLHVSDRRWLLAQMDASQRQWVGPDLGRALRLPAEIRQREFNRLAQGRTATSQTAAGSDMDRRLIERIDAMPEESLTAALRGSPEWLIRVFLGIHSWRCSSAVQLMLPTLRSPQRQSAPGGVAPATQRALLESLLAVMEPEERLHP